MRIGLVIYDSLNTVSGGYLYDRKLVETLESNGDETIVFSQPWHTYPRRFLANWDREFVQRLMSAKLDLLIQDELNHPSLVFLNGQLRDLLDIPLFSIVHHLRSSEAHPTPLKRLYCTIEQRYLESIDGFIFNSQTTRRSVESQLAKPKPAIVAHPGADHLDPPDRAAVAASISDRADDPAPLRILAVGNVSQRKNLHTVLHALAALPAAGWRLTVGGSLDTEASYAKRLRRLTGELDLTDRVHFTGSLTREALRRLYAASHVLALPSYEGFGIVYLEAMSFGVVPIAATVGAAHEIIEDGRNGFLVEPTDEALLTKRLSDMLQSRESWRTLALAARARYDFHPTWRISMQHVTDWLHEYQPSRTKGAHVY